MRRKHSFIAISLASLLMFMMFTVPVFSQEKVPEGEKYGGILKIATTGELPTLDAYASTLTIVQQLFPFIAEGLGALDKNFASRPMLAKSWEPNEDATVWTIPLRQGVLFHNGKEMKATDVKASIERWAKYSVTRARLKSLEKVEIIDDYTIELYFRGPFAVLPMVLSTPGTPLIIMPKEQTETTIGKIYEPIGTGPYKFKERVPDQYLKLERFNEYWQIKNPLPHPNSAYAGHKIAYTDEVWLLPTPEVSTRLAGLGKKEFHIVDQLPVGEYGHLRDTEYLQPSVVTPGQMPQMYLNKKGGVFKNRYLRRAVKVALNMDQILMAITEGKKEFYRLDPGIFYQEMIWHSDVDRGLYNVADPEEAKRWMKKGGYNGEEICLMATKDYDYIYKTGLVVAQQLKDVGFNVNLRIWDWPTLTTRRKDPELWDIFCTGSTNMYDPYMWSKHIGAGIYPGWSESDEMKRCYEILGSETDFDERYRQLEILQFLNSLECVMIKVGDYFVLRGQLKGVHNPNAGSQRFLALNTWIEKEYR